MKVGDLVCGTFDKCYYGIITKDSSLVYAVLWTDEAKPMTYNKDICEDYIEVVD